jgi:hypothetical protein
MKNTYWIVCKYPTIYDIVMMLHSSPMIFHYEVARGEVNWCSRCTQAHILEKGV